MKLNYYLKVLLKLNLENIIKQFLEFDQIEIGTIFKPNTTLPDIHLDSSVFI